MQRFPLAICLTKDGEARFLGHLDLARLVERSLRRSGLPVQRTQGFNPRFRLSFSEALPVGVGSEGEWINLTLDEDLSVDDVRARLSPALPECVRLIDVRKTLFSAAEGPVRYRLQVLDHWKSATDALTELLQCTTYSVAGSRPDTMLDVRVHLAAGFAADGVLLLDLVAANGRPPRPGPLLRALCALAQRAGAPEPVFGACTKLSGAARREGDTTWDVDAEVDKVVPAEPLAASC
ncbi:MAG: TIGR03936 family radical SAM-associated protein [Planctomycetota bacterium]